MAGQFVIRWDEATTSFEPVLIRAALVRSLSGVQLPMEISPPTVSPEGVVELVEDESSSDTEAVFRAQLTEQVLGDKAFYQRVSNQTFTVTVTATPLAALTAAAITAGPTGITQTCTVTVDVPPPTIHWTDDTGRRDSTVLVDADGEDEITLHMTLERYSPSTRRMVDETVEWSHKTAKGFDPRLFGPSEDDLPWVVAQPGSGNSRARSRWRSKRPLPHPDLPGVVPDVAGTIEVHAWEGGSITRRMKDSVRFTRDPILMAPIEFRLVEPHLVAELEQPQMPIPADGKPVDLVFKVKRERDGRLCRRGVISVEIDPATSRGGELPRTPVDLTPDSPGTATFTYTPPTLDYKPYDVYHEDVTIYRGVGESRRKIGTARLFLNPATHLTLEVVKRGLAPSQRRLDFVAGSSPKEVNGTLRLRVTNSSPSADVAFDLRFATLKVGVVGADTEPVEVQLGPHDEGRFSFRLQELAEGLATAPQERAVRQLTAAELPEVVYDDEARQSIDLYDEKVRGYTPFALLDPQIALDLRRYPIQFGRNVAHRPPADFARLIAATELTRVAAGGIQPWKAINDGHWTRGGANFANLLSDAVATIISATSVGDKLAAEISREIALLADSVGPWTQRFVHWAVDELAVSIRYVGQQLTGLVDRLGAQLHPTLLSAAVRLQMTWSAVLDGFAAVLTSSRPLFPDLAKAFAAGIRNVTHALCDALWLVLQIAVSIVGGVVGTALDVAGAALAVVPAAAERNMRALRSLLGAGFVAEEQWGTWSFGKLMEIVTGWLIDQIEVLKTSGSWLGSRSTSLFDLFPQLADDALRFVIPAAHDLRVPEAASGRVGSYNDAFRWLNTRSNHLQKGQLDVDIVMTVLDAVVLGLELAFIGFSMLFTGGLGALGAGAVISKLEVQIGLFKTLAVRAPQLIASFLAALGSGAYFHVNTVGLVAT